MNYDTLGFSITELNNDAAEVAAYYTKYSSALANFKSEADSLSSKWTGDEPGIVAAYTEKLTTAEKALDEAEKLMETLKTTLVNKATEFETAAASAKALF